MFDQAVKSDKKIGSPLRDSAKRKLGPAVRSVVEHLEGRQLMAADPFANENDVQGVPFVLEFDGSATTGLHDKDGEHFGFTRVQVNKNGRTASYVQANLDQVAGLLKITTTGNSSAGSNYNGDNTLTNAVETTFNGNSSGFQITTRLVGPLSYINEPSEQAGISFGPGQDNYIKIVAVSRPEGTRLQFTDEELVGTSYNHLLDATRDIGSFANITSLDLRLVGDAATGKVSAFYAINGGAFQKFSQEITLTGSRKAAFFSTTARAGLVAAHKNNTGAITASFDRFEIQPGTPVTGRPTVASVSPSTAATNVDRDKFVSAQLNLTGGGIDSSSLTSATVRLYRTSDRQPIDANIGTSGAGDVIILTPAVLLEKNTSYTFEVTDGLLDTAGNAFVAFSSTFTTGTAGGEVDGSFSFEKVALNTATGEEFTALKVGPDRKLYAGTVEGRIFRFAINANGTLGAPQVLNVVQNANGGNKRLLTGLTFDPSSTSSNPILWVTHGQYRFGQQPNGSNDEQKYADDWTGKISKITNLGGSNTGTLTDIVTGLPRSVRDHLTNQPSFGPDGALYIPQGSNSAGGAPDVGWGNRPERLLSGAILRLDPSGFNTTTNVKTQDGGNYNPFATGAKVTIYASGVRNAYDLVWTSDGFLYAPTNGTAAGANTPAGGGAPALTNIGAQHDFLFKIVQGGYYGHPNPLRQEYVHGGGYTPDVQGVGPNEVPEYGTTTQPDADYKGFAYDFDLNVSPNGILEYKNTSAFGGALAGKLLVVRYSGPDDVMILTKDSSGAIVQAQKGIAGLGGFVDPLDIIEDPQTGFLYVSEYSERDASKRKITLLRPIPAGAKATPDKPRLVYTDIQTASTGGSGASATQTVTIKNTGTQKLTIPSGGVSIVDDASVSGNHAAEFEAVGWPTLPAEVAVGESISFQVRFRAASVGMKAALLRIQSNATGGTLDVNLRGIGTTSDSNGDVSSAHEPSLQRILNAFMLPINVGDSNGENTYDLPTPRPAGTVHDEIEMQRMVKAGAGPVRIEPLAEFAFNTKQGFVAHLGYYSPGTKDAKTQITRVDVSERSSTNPTWGGSFDPGAAAFALYGEFPSGSSSNLFDINGLPRGVYSEDVFNTWDSANQKKVRFFPLKNPDGTIEPNAYVFALEEFNSGYDSNDVVGIIRNVKPAANGPEIGTQNVDRQPSTEAGGAAARALNPTVLSFNRIQTGATTGNVVHDTAKMRIRNSGNAPLTINSIVLTNTTHFQLVSPPAAGTVIGAGGFVDVTVKFIATSGRIKTGNLTINSNDADEATTDISLVGYWQNRSENQEEPTLDEFMQLFGYGTQVTYPGEQLFVPGDEGKVRRTGDEVLSAYWRRSNPAAAVEVIQLAAYHTQGNVAVARWHYANSSTTNTIFTHDGEDGQSILPRLDGQSQLAAGTFKPLNQGSDTNPAFGFRFDTEWSDPTRNPQEKSGGGYGHHVRFWIAKDLNGNVIPDTYIVGMDYVSINFDYQDNLYVVRNIKPVSGPSAPTNAIPTASGAGIFLNWNDNSEPNLAGYNVYRGATSSFTPSSANKLNTGGVITQSDYNDIFAPTGSTSHYKISAVDSSGGESGFTLVSATRTADTTAPAAPTNLVVTGSASAITLDWDNNVEADLAGYDVLRATSASGTYTKQNTNGLLTTSSYVDTTAVDGTTYFYRVVAKDQSGNTSAPATGQGARGAVALPAAPTNLAATGTDATSASLTWNASSGATSYRVERKGPNDADFVQIALGVTTTSYTDTTLSPSTTYQYRVRAENAGGVSVGYSNVDSATTDAGTVTPPSAPTLSATAFSSTQINLSWSASATATSYRIERRVQGAATFDEIAAGVTSTSYQDTGRNPSTTYEYQIRAENSAGPSNYSNLATATTPAAPTPGAYTGTPIAATGSHTVVSEGVAYDVQSTGVGITNTSDGFYFLSRPVTGDFDVKVRVDSITGGNTIARGGLMARASLTANSAHMFAGASVGDGFRTARRTTTGGSGIATKSGTPAYPNAWVRLQRVGNVFTAYYGSNGTSWTQMLSTTIALPQTVELGLASSAYGSSNTSFKYRELGDTNAGTPAPGVPSSLTATPYSADAIDLNWQRPAETVGGYRVERKGPGDSDFVQIASTTDTFYTDSNLLADTVYQYRVRSFDVSETVFSGYSNVASATIPAIPAAPTNLTAVAESYNQIVLNWSASAGAETYTVEARVLGETTWINIDDLLGGTTLHHTPVTPETTYEYRVYAVNVAGDSGYSNIASATTPAEPIASDYSSNDIATPVAGSTNALPDGASFDITGGGTNILGTADSFRFVYRELTGDFDVKAQITGRTNTNGTPKLGLMARNDIGANSANVFAHVASNGYRISRRATAGADTDIVSNGGMNSFPNTWVRLQRVGDTFTAFRSTDGTNWTAIGSYTQAAPTTMLVGMAVTAQSSSQTTIAAFRNVGDLVVAPPTAPSAPANLQANAFSSTQVNLTWQASAGATNYRVERKGPGDADYVEIAGNVTTTSYQDTGRLPETEYHYRVRAENGVGLSGYSLTADVTTPATPAPSAYTGVDIASSPAGSTTALPDGTSFDLVAGGSNVIGAADSFHFGYRQITGDFDVKGQLSSLSDTSGSPKAGFMARTDLSAGSANVFAHVASNGYRISRRATAGANTDIISSGGLNSYPNTWLRLQRVGDVFTAYRSTNGTSWTEIGSYTAALPNTVLVGMAATAQASGQTTTAAFRNVGDVTSVPPTGPAAPTNVVATAPSTTQADLTWQAVSGATKYRVERKAPGESSFLEIVNNWTATTFSDGGRTPGATYEYRVRAENSEGLSDYSNIAEVTMPGNPNPSAYTLADIATPLAGNTQALSDGTSFNTLASGTNIVGTSDSFHFVYKEMTGDFDIKAQLTSLSDTSGSPKAGLMARTDLSAGSANVYSHVASNGYRISRRLTAGANTDIISNGGMNSYPNTWLRLQRAGDVFTAYRSTNGTSWTVISSYTAALPSTLLVGMATSAQSSSQTTSAQYRNVGNTVA